MSSPDLSDDAAWQAYVREECGRLRAALQKADGEARDLQAGMALLRIKLEEAKQAVRDARED